MGSEEHAMAQEQITRYPKNAPGDFYVENDCCITCEAPYHEAPDLMAHDDEEDYRHCYFKRQPEKPEEVERAIMACYVSCVRAVRYAGRNPKILKRFQELGSVDSCDVLSPDEDKALPLTLREKLERLRGAQGEQHRSPPAHDDHPLYDQELDG
jgi:hypothetical protein